MDRDEKSRLYYICPECGNEQLVYLVPDVITESEPYTFTTECDDCGTELLLKLGFEMSIERWNEDG